ncbi:MAG: PTS sugar transporter subunit IIB [Gemmatimonadales bacterium]|jgi:PTS system mannose-specific IIB component/fructoselysine and glucoselysine-specific PTS system IIB component
MSIVLTRVDDRLIHGQVVVGWAQALRVDRIVLIDDEVRANAWERELYSLGVPPGLDVEFLSVEEAAESMQAWGEAGERTMLLVGNVDTVVRLAQRCPEITRINVGGVHEGNGRTQRLKYVYLNDEEADQLRRLRDHGVEVTAQDVPTAKKASLDDWL